MLVSLMLIVCLMDRSEWACGTVSSGGHLEEMDTHTIVQAFYVFSRNKLQQKLFQRGLV